MGRWGQESVQRKLPEVTRARLPQARTRGRAAEARGPAAGAFGSGGAGADLQGERVRGSGCRAPGSDGFQPRPRRTPGGRGSACTRACPEGGRLDGARRGGLREGTRLPADRAARGPPRPRRCPPRPWPRWARSRSPRSQRCAPRGGRRACRPGGPSSASTCPRSRGGCGEGGPGPSPLPPRRGAAPRGGAAASRTSSGASCPPAPGSRRLAERGGGSRGGGGAREAWARPLGPPRARPRGGAPPAPLPAAGYPPPF